MPPSQGRHFFVGRYSSISYVLCVLLIATTADISFFSKTLPVYIADPPWLLCQSACAWQHWNPLQHSRMCGSPSRPSLHKTLPMCGCVATAAPKVLPATSQRMPMAHSLTASRADKHAGSLILATHKMCCECTK